MDINLEPINPSLLTSIFESIGILNAKELSMDNSTDIFCPMIREWDTFPIFLPNISTSSPTLSP